MDGVVVEKEEELWLCVREGEGGKEKRSFERNSF